MKYDRLKRLLNQIQSDIDFAAEHGLDRVDCDFDTINDLVRELGQTYYLNEIETYGDD